MEKCPLCLNSAEDFYKNKFFICKTCAGIFRPPTDYPSEQMEKARYELHQNDASDEGYREFVSPITIAILKKFTREHVGLDFGAGPESAVSAVLKEQAYNINLYDPFFHDSPKHLKNKYDYIVCCEVMEHFHKPAKEFRLLTEMLKPGGYLYCQTNLYNPEIDFDQWYYKNDFTHVFIYQLPTLEWIRKAYGFNSLEVKNRLITFS